MSQCHTPRGMSRFRGAQRSGSGAVPSRIALCLATAFLCASARAAPSAPIPQDGLVLWLDASDAESVTADDAGRVSGWADRSGQGHRAMQPDAARRPTLVPRALGGKPALRFDGSAFLNLGQPEALDFRPGDPFTLAAVFQVAGGDYGTLISRGGGPAGGRSYQLYVAPGRQGLVCYGSMHECPTRPGPRLAVARCDGAEAEVLVGGRSAMAFHPARGRSRVDVLLGARREGADNAGTFWPLTGEVAEVIAYNRALDSGELEQLTAGLHKKYGLGAPARSAADSARQIARLAEEDPAGAAERLLRLAERNKLTDELACLAADLLTGDDPFARGMAEWAIAMKVGHDNNGQELVWTGGENSDWLRPWMGLSAAARLEADWVRQAVSKGIHNDPKKLATSFDAMADRARRMVDAFRRRNLSPDGLRHLEKQRAALESIRPRLVEAAKTAPRALAAAQRLWLDAREAMREIALAHPALDFQQIVFVKQFAPHTVRNITRSYNWKHKPGGDIFVLDGLQGGTARPVLRGRLGPGYVWGLDLWWGGDRVVFSYARQPRWPPPVDTADYGIEGRNVFRLRQMYEPMHLFEATLDGSQLVQLTDDPYWSDFEPTYCAHGDIVFASDRCGRSAECGNDTYDHTNPNLYILSRNQTSEFSKTSEVSVRKFTDSKDIDRYPHSLDDGRIGYTHWEYQERHFMEVHALWTARPDGTQSDALFKHHMRAPLALRDTRSVPGSTRLVSVATGHHTFAYGPVVLVDPAHGMSAADGLRIVTPGVKPQEGPMAGRAVDQGGVRDAGGLYHTPWALSEDCFLVSYAYARPNCRAPSGVDANGFGLYLIDAWGNRELLHRDPLLGCTFPLPLKERPRPPILPPHGTGSESAGAGSTKTRDGEVPVPLPQDAARKPPAVCYVPDVYDGMDPGVERGTIKSLRVSQRVPWPFDSDLGQHDYIPGNASSKRVDFQSWSPVRVIGTVPVEADGSAHFTVPADVALYFQALDERQMEIVRMRSYVSLKSGEVRGCRGCHESQAQTPAVMSSLGTALRRPAREPEAPPWGSERLLGYEWLVQPVLDRHCTSCHGPEKAEGGIDLSAARGPDGLLRSYRTMFGDRDGKPKAKAALVSCSNRFDPADVTRPKQFGSHRSPLIRVLLDDPVHREQVKLPADDWTALVTWVDANAPYFDAFLNKRPEGGGPPCRDVRPRLGGAK